MKQNWKDLLPTIGFTIWGLLSVFLEDFIPDERTLRIIRYTLLILLSLGWAMYSLISTVRRHKKSNPFLRSEWLETFMLGLSVLLLIVFLLLPQTTVKWLKLVFNLSHTASLVALIFLTCDNNDKYKANLN